MSSSSGKGLASAKQLLVVLISILDLRRPEDNVVLLAGDKEDDPWDALETLLSAAKALVITGLDTGPAVCLWPFLRMNAAIQSLQKLGACTMRLLIWTGHEQRTLLSPYLLLLHCVRWWLSHRVVKANSLQLLLQSSFEMTRGWIASCSV